MKPVRIHSEAKAEAKQAAMYLESKRDELGEEFLTLIEQEAENIARSPKAFEPYEQGFRRRVVKRFGFAIFYKEFDDYIWIAAIANCRREQDYWMDRQPE